MLIVKRIFYLAMFSMVFMACRKNSGVNIFNSAVETESMVNQAVTVRINDAIGGYYVALPSLYNKTSKAYPLLFFIHGAGQYGNGSTELYYLGLDGPAKLIDQKKFPASFHVNGKDFSFIIMTPQFSRFPNAEEVMTMINYTKKKYRIDNARVYLSGLSLGGFVSVDVASRHASSIAAIVPISGILIDSLSCINIAHGNVPVWSFHNIYDPSIAVETEKIFEAKVNSYHPLRPPKLTLFPDYGHDAWTKALDPAYREDNKDIYEWMLQYTR